MLLLLVGNMITFRKKRSAVQSSFKNIFGHMNVSLIVNLVVTKLMFSAEVSVSVIS